MMRRPAMRLTQDDKIVRRKWAFAVLGVLAALVVSTLSSPPFQNASPKSLVSGCLDDRAGEAGARLIETKGATDRRLATDPQPSGCSYQSQNQVSVR
jgi:hypothetical protein